MAHLLVVDDDEDIRTLVELALSQDGHTVDTAADGIEAIDLINQQPYAAIVLDVGMPRMSGLEVATCVTQGGTTHRPRILMLSAYAGRVDQERGREAGADTYLVKGTPLSEIKRAVSALVQAPTAGTSENLPLPSS